MISKKKVVIFTAVFLIIATIIIIFISGIIKYNNVQVDNVPYFIQYKSYVSSPIDSTYTIDYVYFSNKNEKDLFNEKGIDKVILKDSQNVIVENFKINEGGKSKKYKIMTLALTLKFINEAKEKIKFLDIYFKDNTMITFPVGEWYFDISGLPVGNHLRIGNRYNLVTKYIYDYYLSIENTSKDNLEINRLSVDIENVMFDFEKFILEPNASVNRLIKIKITNLTLNHTFYYIKPRVEYNVGNDEFAFYPFGVNYGLLNMTDETIENEVQKNMDLY